MAVPKKKTSSSKRNMRRSHDKVKSINVVFNKETGEPQLPHRVSVDGYYGSRQVIKPKVKEASDENKGEEVKNNDAAVEDKKDSK
jgi:large subunit ribosomal protein L32